MRNTVNVNKIMDRVREKSLTLNCKEMVEISWVEQSIRDVLREEERKRSKIIDFWGEEV